MLNLLLSMVNLLLALGLPSLVEGETVKLLLLLLLLQGHSWCANLLVLPLV